MENITKKHTREIMEDVNRQHQKILTKWIIISFSIGAVVGSMVGVYLYIVLP